MDGLIALKNPHFSILSGDDPSGVRAMLAGAEGVISVAANVAPAAFRAICDAALGGNTATAQALNTLRRVRPAVNECTKSARRRCSSRPLLCNRPVSRWIALVSREAPAMT
jgi:hypothetical protein